jgi:hypothetical protein
VGSFTTQPPLHKFRKETLPGHAVWRERERVSQKDKETPAKFYYIPEFENRTMLIFWRMCKKPVEKPATTVSILFYVCDLMKDNPTPLP